MRLSQQNIDFSESDRVTWLANEIFKAFPETVSGLTFYILDCGYVYYWRKFVDRDLNHKVGIYRNFEDGPCQVCMGTGNAGWLMKGWFIIANSRLAKDRLDLVIYD